MIDVVVIVDVVVECVLSTLEHVTHGRKDSSHVFVVNEVEYADSC